MSEDAEAVTQAVEESVTNSLEGDAKSVSDAVEGKEPPVEAPAWYLTEEMQGEGEKPEYMLDKFKNLAEQAKSFGELEKRFGGFTGAPETYELNLNEEIAKAGVEIGADDPLVVKAMEMAKETNMNQEGFTRMLELYGQSRMAEQTAFQEQRENEIKSLGPQGDTRLKNLDNWAKLNLSADQYESFGDLAHSAGAVQTLERLVSMTRSAPMAPETGGQQAQGLTVEQLHEMQFAVDEHGQRKMQNPEYAKEVRRMQDQLYGSGDHRIVIGG